MPRKRSTNARWAVPLLFAVALSMALPSHRGGAQIPPTETLTFSSIADTYVESSQANQNFNGDTRLRADADPVRIIFLRFAVSGVGGRQIESARLRLQVAGPSDATGGTIHRISNNTWNESTVTYNTRPAVDGPGLQSLGPVEDGEIVEFIVDDEITGDGVYNFAIDTPSTDSVSYVSAAAASG